MNVWNTRNIKEKLVHSGRAAVRLLAWLRAGVGKTLKFLVAGRRRMAASSLAVCLLLTMLPAVSLPVAASTGLWNAAGTKTDNLIPTPTLPVVSGGKTLSTGEGSDKAGWQTHWDTQMKPAGWGSKGISGPDNALQVYATKAEDGSQTFAIRPVDGGKSGSNACLGGAGDTSERAAGISYTVTLDAYAKELADNGDLVTNVSAEFYKQEWMSCDLSISMEFLDENGKRLSSEGTKPYVKAGLGIHITTDADGVWVEWDELGGGSYVSRAVNKVAVPVGTATIRYWFCNYSNVGNARKAIKNLQANFVSTATHTHPSCGDYLCTEHENVEFSLWESNSSLPTEAGYYSLTQDVTLSSSWQLSSNVHLCLNGHTVTRTGSGTLISVASGGSLSLYDCTENSGKVTGGADGIHVRNGGALVLYGGDITANGTGVRLGTASGTGTGTFTMYAGEYDIVPRNATADNYNITFKKGTLTVKPAQLSDIEWIDITPVALIYNGQQKDIRITYSGWLNNDDVRFVFQLHGDNVNVTEDGFYWVITGLAGTKAGNYLMPDDNLTSPTYQVTPRTLRESDFTAITDGRIYTGLENEPAVSSTNPLVRATDYTVAYENNINAGENTAKITITGKNNASGTVDIYFSIAKADPPVVWPFPPVGNAGDKLSTVALEDGFTWDNADTTILYGDNYYGMTYTPSDTNNYNILKKDIRVNGKDVTVPTGTLTIDVDSWNTFWNNVTFGLFFKNTQRVTVVSADTESGVSKTEYYLATAEMSDFTGVEWTAFEDEFNINPNNAYVVYVRITDRDGNAAIINSAGVVLDDLAPAISGITDSKTYYKEVEVTVTDANLDRVEVNGVPVAVDADGKCKLTASADTQKVVAFDKAGNVSAAITVTVEAEHSFVWGEWYDNHNGTHSKDAHCVCGAALTITAPKDEDVVANGLEKEAVVQGTDLHLVIETNVENIDAGAMADIKAELGKGITAVYIDITVKDAVGDAPIANTAHVLEIPVAFAFADKLSITVYRNHEGVVEDLRALDARPEGDFEDGTYYLDRENDLIYIYSNQFSTYGVAYHAHSLTTVPKTDATPEADGNIAYWYCEGCDKYFADAEGKNEIAKSETVIKYVQSPQTGDNSANAWGYVAVLFVSGLPLFGVIAAKKRKEEETE